MSGMPEAAANRNETLLVVSLNLHPRFSAVTALLSFLCITACCSLVSSRLTANSRASSEDIAEISATLFPVHRVPLADEDTWNRLDDHDREAWSFSNYMLHDGSPDGSPLEIARAKLMASTHILVPVRIVILLGDDRIRPARNVSAMERAMRAGTGSGIGSVIAQFRISFASAELVDQLRGLSDAQEINNVLEKEYSEGSRWHGSNVMFVLVNFAGMSLPADKPRLGKERLSWLFCRETDRLLDVLAAVEVAVGRIYVPEPLSFPVTLSGMLRISVHPYTPGHSHRALWFGDFPWHLFESTVRDIAPHGQTVGFFATQSNAECDACTIAFEKIDGVYRDRGKRAADVLVSRRSRSILHAAASKDNVLFAEGLREPATMFSIYVIDTAHATEHSPETLQKLEKMRPAVYPGVAIIALRSTRREASDRLKLQMIACIAAGAYGVSEPMQYIEASSDVLRDAVSRNIVASLVASRADEVVRLLLDIEEFGVQPKKVLTDRQYAALLQRINLLVFKLEHALDVLSSSNDATTAIRYASAAAHDVCAIRHMFGLNPNGVPYPGEGFRDPTVRCHFSRIKRGALRAGFIFREGTSHHSRALAMGAVYVSMSLASYGVFRILNSSQGRLKAH
jgi:hypothetical protein